MRSAPLHGPIATALLALLCSSPARAQTPDGAYPYVGIGIGQARARVDATRLGAGALDDRGLAISTTSRDERDTAYRIFGGLQFNHFIAVEAGYSRLGQFGYQAQTSPTGRLDGRLKLQALTLDLVGSLPLGERLSALARAGYQRTRTNADWSGSGAAAIHGSTHANDSAPRYGVGLQYAVTPQFLLRTEAERSRFADAQGGTVRASVYSASIVMPFGNAPMSAPRAAYALPEPPRAMAAPPPPLPVAIAAPAPPMPALAPAPVPLRRVSFAAESLFAFDSAELLPPGKTALDTFAGELAGTRYDSIQVTGHTDRLGSTAYNQTLSLKRADAVKSYLVSSAKLDAASISAEGLSESLPVTRPDDCKGRSSPRVIACLQPDRRVEIRVSGTR